MQSFVKAIEIIRRIADQYDEEEAKQLADAAKVLGNVSGLESAAADAERRAREAIATAATEGRRLLLLEDRRKKAEIEESEAVASARSEAARLLADARNQAERSLSNASARVAELESRYQEIDAAFSQKRAELIEITAKLDEKRGAWDGFRAQLKNALKGG